MPAPGDDMLIMVCGTFRRLKFSQERKLIRILGPSPMMEAVSGNKAKDKSQGELTGMLKTMGYTEKQVFKF
jgi:hypothetical protein